MAGEAQRSARKLKAALVARLHDPATNQHQHGLLQAVRLCERFINANASSEQAYDVLKAEVAKVMLAQQQVKPKPPAATCRTRSFKAGTCTAAATTTTAGARMHSKTNDKVLIIKQPMDCSRISSSNSGKGAGHQAVSSAASLGWRAKTTASVFNQDLDQVPTLLLEHKAHLTDNAFDRIIKLQDKKCQAEDHQWQLDRRRQQQQLRSELAVQLAERDAVREAQRQDKLREVQETDEALAAAYKAGLQEMQQKKEAQQRQWNMYRQQQQEAEAVRQVAAEGALREQLIERAELEAAQAAEAAGAAELAAANRAKLEEFKAETLAGLEAKKQEALIRREQERVYTEECKKAMDAAEAKRLADQEVWRQRQHAKYMRAGGLSIERDMEHKARAAAEKAEREAATHEAKQAAEVAARRAAEMASALSTANDLKQQMAHKEAGLQAAAAQKAAEAAAAAQQRLTLEATFKAEKEAAKAAKQLRLQQQKQELSEWRQRKFDELNAPLLAGDAWVHKEVLAGQKLAFTMLKK